MWNEWVKFQKFVGKNPLRFWWVCGKRLFWGKNGEFTSKMTVDWPKSRGQRSPKFVGDLWVLVELVKNPLVPHPYCSVDGRKDC